MFEVRCSAPDVARCEMIGDKNQRGCAIVYNCCGLSFAKERESSLHVPAPPAAFAGRKLELEIRIT